MLARGRRAGDRLDLWSSKRAFPMPSRAEIPWPENSPLPWAELEAIELRTRDLGRVLFEQVEEQRPGVLHRRWCDDRVM